MFSIFTRTRTRVNLYKVWYLRFFILVDKEIHQLSCQCNHSFKNDRFFHGCVFFISLFVFCFGTIGTFDHTDIQKKARHEISLMSSKKEICVRRLEDYQTLRHYTVDVHNVFFYFIHYRHLFTKWYSPHYFPILNR